LLNCLDTAKSRKLHAAIAILKPAGGEAESNVGPALQNELPVHTGEGSVPDLFDRWMEEYASKVSSNEFRTGMDNEEHTAITEADEKGTAVSGSEEEFER
jgi:hypothetical protein